MKVKLDSGDRTQTFDIGIGHTEGLHDQHGQLAVFVKQKTPRSTFVEFIEKNGLGPKLNRNLPQQRLTRAHPIIEHEYSGVIARASLVIEKVISQTTLPSHQKQGKKN